MFRNLIRLFLIFALTLTVSCAAQKPQPVEETITIPKAQFEELKSNSVKLGQDAKYYKEKYHDCINSKQ